MCVFISNQRARAHISYVACGTGTLLVEVQLTKTGSSPLPTLLEHLDGHDWGHVA